MTATLDPTTEPHHDPPVPAMAARVLLASLSLAAGVIHLVMVPVHAESTTDAVGFALAGWLQVLVAIGLLVRPSRFMLQAAVVVNAVAAGLWVWSRTLGLPFGGASGVAEDVGLIDGLAALFAGAVALGALVLLARPTIADRVSEPLLIAGSLIPVAALIATSVALSDPTVVEHDHGSAAEVAGDAGHLHGTGSMDLEMASIAAARCDLDINPAAYWRETAVAGIDTVMGGSHGDEDAHAVSTNAPSAPGTPELDLLIAATAKEGGELKDADVVVALSEASDETYDRWLQWLPTYAAAHGHGENAAAPDDNGGHGGHIGPQPWIAMTDPAECDQLRSELATAREVALRYPTAADATAAGWTRVTGYVPGIAAHYMKFSYVDGEFDVSEPEMLLYDGNGPDAAMVGLSYYLIHHSDTEPTQGFTGPNDHFHRHVGLCIGIGGVIGDSTMTAEECAAIGGRKAAGEGGWMNHVWIVPGCESPWGMFSGASPLLDRTLSERSGTDGGACAGSGVRDRYDLRPGDDSNTPTTVRGELETAAAD
jgi:hypothetical protein